MNILVDVEEPEPEEEYPFPDVKIIKVVKTVFYAVPANGDNTAINGWDIEKVAEDWFERHPIAASHATRDYYQIGNAEKVEKVEIITLEEYENERRDDRSGASAGQDSDDDSRGTSDGSSGKFHAPSSSSAASP